MTKFCGDKSRFVEFKVMTHYLSPESSNGFDFIPSSDITLLSFNRLMPSNPIGESIPHKVNSQCRSLRRVQIKHPVNVKGYATTYKNQPRLFKTS